MSEQHWAAVCLNGHVKTSHIPTNVRDALATDQLPRPTQVPNYCGECGAKILLACRSCKAGIVGEWEGEHFAGWRPGAFCWTCGAPYPWATREQRVGKLYDEIDHEDLDEATLLTVREQIAVLSVPVDEETDEHRDRALERLKKLVPKTYEAVLPVLQGLATAEMKRRLELP